MNIYEAIKSGKRFRRPLWEAWITLDMGYIQLHRLNALATDWEVEEREVTLTESQINDTFLKIYGTNPNFTSKWVMFLEALGFRK